MKLKRIVTIILLIVGAFQMLTYGQETVSSVTEETQMTSVASLGADHTQDGHDHGCGEGDPCGHQCHFGHCSFALAASGTISMPNLLSATFDLSNNFRPDPSIGNLFRPPIA